MKVKSDTLNVSGDKLPSFDFSLNIVLLVENNSLISNKSALIFRSK